MTDLPEPRVPDAVRNRNRMMLLLIFGLFLGSFVLAGLLRFSGFIPDGARNRGELFNPPADVRFVPVQRLDGQAYVWESEPRVWRMLVPAPASCDTRCDTVLEQLHLVWQLFGKDADRVQVLWMGQPPAMAEGRREVIAITTNPDLLQALPQSAHADTGAGLPVYIVDPNGFVILRYAPGFDPGDVRTDMARLLKLK